MENKKYVTERLLAVAEKRSMSASPHTYEKLGWVTGIMVKVPAKTARHLKFVKGHKLLVPSGKDFRGVEIVKVADHYRHGDYPLRKSDGSVRPAMTRNFYVPSERLGKYAMVDIVFFLKTNILTGEETLILDMTDNPNVIPQGELVVGKKCSGGRYEIPIPGTDDLVVYCREV